MTFLYYLFGKNEDFECELVYSLTSLTKTLGKRRLSRTKIIIYSDREFSIPSHLGFLKISTEVISKRVFSKWTNGAANHFFIIKPLILIDFLTKFNEPCVLIDTDTFFIRTPSYIFREINRHSIFIHLKECVLSEFDGIPSFFNNHRLKAIDGTELPNIGNFHMYNCGTVGVCPANIPLLTEVVNLVKQMANSEHWPEQWSRLSEQTAFSYFIQKNNFKIGTTDNSIIHYWFFKESRYLLANKFNYFHAFDRKVKVKGLNKINYKNFAEFLCEIIRIHALMPESFFKYIPQDTMIGKLLRANRS